MNPAIWITAANPIVNKTFQVIQIARAIAET